MKILIFVLVFAFAGSVIAQTPKADDPKDVGSLDAIMKAVYDVISGDAGKPRDWDRFRSLFHKDARLIPSGKNPQTGVAGANAFYTRRLHQACRSGLCQRRFSRTRTRPPRRSIRQYRTGIFDLSRISKIGRQNAVPAGHQQLSIA